MNASRMRRPSAVRTGMFCRLGSFDARRPVTAVACANVVCTRPVLRVDHQRQLVGVGRLQLRQRAVLEQDLRQRIVGGELLQHFLVGGRRAGRRLLQHGQLHPLEQDLADLLRRAEVERLPGELVRLLLERHHALAELAALRAEQRRVDQHAVALHAEQHSRTGISMSAIDGASLASAAICGYSASCSRSVTSASSAAYSVARSTATCSNGDAVRALAGDFVVGDRLHVEMPPREAVHVVRLVRFEHVRLQQRVVRDAAQREAVVGEHVLVVLEVLPELLLRRIGEPRREARQRRGTVELVRRAGVAMRERDVGTRGPARPTARCRRCCACIGSRLVVSVSNAVSSARSMSASQRASAASSSTVS